MPRPVVLFPCGSQSTKRTFKSFEASDAAKLMAVVVLPTPPFWLATAMILPNAQTLTRFAICFTWNKRVDTLHNAVSRETRDAPLSPRNLPDGSAVCSPSIILPNQQPEPIRQSRTNFGHLTRIDRPRHQPIETPPDILGSPGKYTYIAQMPRALTKKHRPALVRFDQQHPPTWSHYGNRHAR